MYRGSVIPKRENFFENFICACILYVVYTQKVYVRDEKYIVNRVEIATKIFICQDEKIIILME